MEHSISSGSAGRSDCIGCTVKPNPTSGRFNIITSGKDLRFILFNRDGQLIKSHTINSTVTNLSIEDCETGTYFLKVSNGETLYKLIRVVKI
jgi:hypothetical protein